MVSVLLNWMYIFLTAYAMGFLVSKFAAGRLRYQVRETGSVVSIGIVTVTVYAQFFSLACKVGLLANLVLLLSVLSVYAVWHGEIGKRWKDALTGSSHAGKALMFVLVILWAYCTSRGGMHYDSDLYHAQGIRWIEEYGVVKGLGNIHVRFAYNSSFLALSALYSMKFLTGRSLHAVNGFIALLLSLEVMKLADAAKRRRLLLSDFARIGAFYYLTVIYSEIIAPASDYAIMCTVFYIVIKWLSQLEEDRNRIAPFALLCVGGVFAVSLKLTAGLILLLTVKPASMLIREKRWKETAVYLVMGMVILFPWMARTVLISGYLLYPFPALDVFSVDWKIPQGAAALDAAEIKTWGRGLNNAALVDMGVSEWFPDWFGTMLPAVGKILVILDLLCVVLSAVMLVCLLADKKKRTPAAADAMLALGSVVLSYLFWQLSAPLLRYGYAYVLLVVVLTAGVVWSILPVERAFPLMLAALALFTLVKSVSLARYLYSVSGKPCYVWQGDYGAYALASYEVQGVTFYYPQGGDRTGYGAFPALPARVEIKFRGNGLKDGFVPASP